MVQGCSCYFMWMTSLFKERATLLLMKQRPCSKVSLRSRIWVHLGGCWVWIFTITSQKADFVSLKDSILRRFYIISTCHNRSLFLPPLVAHFKLSTSLGSLYAEKETYMSIIPYACAVGSLMYAMVCTSLDIAHAVSVVSHFMSNPGKEHWKAVQWMLRYLRGTSKIWFDVWSKGNKYRISCWLLWFWFC